MRASTNGLHSYPLRNEFRIAKDSDLSTADALFSFSVVPIPPDRRVLFSQDLMPNQGFFCRSEGENLQDFHQIIAYFGSHGPLSLHLVEILSMESTQPLSLPLHIRLRCLHIPSQCGRRISIAPKRKGVCFYPLPPLRSAHSTPEIGCQLIGFKHRGR